MAARVPVIPFRPRPTKKKLVSDAVLGMILFVFVEIMLFAGFISAFVIIKARAVGSVWPPPNQPRLPFAETAVNTTALIASGIVLLIAHRMFLKGRGLGGRTAELGTGQAGSRGSAGRMAGLGGLLSRPVGRLLVAATLLGGMFVGLQGVEWLALIREGLTITSSTYGALFYTIIGAHAAHAVAAILALAWAAVRLRRGTLTRDALSAVAIFWYFVVLVWPFLYVVVYL
ncbi:MAG: cytochrome c oxidase subunit 3 [Gemmatimonadota bacterium]|nr:cytochrome c oxidase subunit 3 [Gemmatimonadota bacterium]